MMNLGDGLLFDLENGKPRLLLAKYGAESEASYKKNSCRILPRKKIQKIINLKKGPPQANKDEQDRKNKDTETVSSVRQNISRRPRITQNTKCRSESMSSEAVRVQAESNKNEQESCIPTQQKENVVCLTKEQFQHILSPMKTRTAEPVNSSEEKSPGFAGGTGEFSLDGCNKTHRVSEVKKNRQLLSNQEQSGLFSTFGERERERDKLEARKAQWRRDLDEQMAMKRQEKDTLKDRKAYDKSCEVRLKELPNSDGSTIQTAAGIKSLNHRAPPQNQQELPAAIRSAFILGEAAPVEDMFKAQREEQQRRWLQELDQQIKDAKLRRQRDKEINSQVENIERWAIHFDSLHQPLTVGPEQRVADLSSCLSNHQSVSGTLSAVWEGMSVCGGDSLGRASVDTTQGNQQRSSYLRTMTALLDPAQIEERERRRLKQLEHQQAIEAQVEERKCQKEREEATRRAQEQEEERRVERECLRLQQQYLRDTERQRQREEVQSRKTEELYLSIQRAQEEAFKDKHFQRIRDLAKKGHDVSKLLHSLDGDSVSQAFSSQDLSGTSATLTSSKSQTQRMASSSTTSPRKDTAVQTEIIDQPETETIRDADKQSSNPGVTCSPPPNTLKSMKSHHGEVKASEKNHCKDVFTAPKQVEDDHYEPYARTDRNHKLEKRPEWNTQKPSKAFVPASERYPEALQRHRKESRRQRQIELMTLVEKNSRTPQQEPLPLPYTVNNHKPQAQRHRKSPQIQSENQLQEPSAFSYKSRVMSPLVHVVKNHVHLPSQQSSCQMTEEMAHPPLLDYVPYVRTDEVYHMDPLAPLSRTSTQEAQQRVNTVVSCSSSRQVTPQVQNDPDPPKSTERQQAILKGLSELRQGLLQRQRELETSLNPALQTQHRNYFSPFRPV